MRVLDPAGSVRRYLDFPPSQTVRRVEMERGRAGYGFTMAGQAPCVLSGIMKGSPAHSVGLRPGDYILSVNGTDVSEAAHETVVELIGSSSRSLCLLVTSADQSPGDTSSSDEELTFQKRQKATWLNPGKLDSNTWKPYEKDMNEPLMQSVGSFDTIFETSGQASANIQSKTQSKQRPMSEPDMSYWTHQNQSKHHPHILGHEKPTRVVSKDSVFTDFQSQNNILPDSSALNVEMVVGYISSIELDLITSHSELDTLRTIRECISRIGIEQKTHSLVMMRIKCSCVQLCDDRDVVLASYPTENLALCVICTEDNRFFCLVSINGSKTVKNKAEDSTSIKALCHVFFIDPELYLHKEHENITEHFGFSCTPDPDTQGCLEFPQTPYSVLHFVSVLYTDLGDYIEKLRVKLDSEDSDEGHTNARNSGSGDSGIGNGSPEDRESLADKWSLMSPNTSHLLWNKPPPYSSGKGHNGVSLKPERRCLLSEPFPSHALSVTPQTGGSTRPEDSGCTPLQPPTLIKPQNLPENVSKRRGSQRWPTVGIRARWQKTRPNSIESLPDSDPHLPKEKNGTLPPAMEKIPTLRYKTPNDPVNQQRPNFDLTRKLFGSGSKIENGENKVTFVTFNNCIV